ncbi:MAG TPA: transcriptional regulator, partial [Blastocatellia bacterium]|nr:transcriptional regulator [Blastocatellia bacterium]
MNEAVHQETGMYEFGPFQIDPIRRIVARDGITVPLTPKAFDTLLVLIQNSGQVLEKSVLMQEVWRDCIVEENNLTQSISALRKALGETRSDHRYIVTIPGRGYCFVPAVTRSGNGAAAAAESSSSTGPVREGATEDGSARPERLSYRLNIIRVRRVSLAVGGMTIVLAGALAAGLLRKNDRHFGEMKITRITGGTGTRYAAISPDGKYVGYVTREEGRQSLWIRQVATSSTINLVQSSDVDYRGLTFSPD